jgi:hypothetical protein
MTNDIAFVIWTMLRNPDLRILKYIPSLLTVAFDDIIIIKQTQRMTLAKELNLSHLSLFHCPVWRLGEPAQSLVTEQVVNAGALAGD